MPSKERRRKAARKAYDERRKASKTRNLSAERESKRRYAAKNASPLRRAREKYKHSEAGMTGREVYSRSATAVQARERYNNVRPEVGKQAREKYNRLKPEVGEKAREKYHRLKSEVAREACKRYHQLNPEIGLKARKKYAKANPEIAAAASKRQREKKRRYSRSRDAVVERQINRQLRFLHLLPSREYAYVGGRAFLRTGRLVAQRDMERMVALGYQKLGIQQNQTKIAQLVQRAVNKRNQCANSLKNEAEKLKEFSEEVLAIIDSSASVSLSDLCGESGHEQRREPFFYDFAYKAPSNVVAGIQSRPYQYARLRAKAVAEIAKMRARFPDTDHRSRLTPKVRQVEMKRKQCCLRRKVAFKRSSKDLRCPVIAMGCKDGHPERDSMTWPCDDHCHYPENGVKKLADVLRPFTNVSHIRRVIADIDSCCNSRGCHPAVLVYPEDPSVAEDWSEDRLSKSFPSIRQRDKLGHSSACLLCNCKSRLLFLRQLAVHFKRMHWLVRLIYLLIATDRELQKIDEALIRGDIEVLVGLVKSGVASDGSKEVPVQRAHPLVTPEELFSTLPYAKALEKAFYEKPECVCMSCHTMHYRKTVKEVFVTEKRQRISKLRPLKDTAPTLHVGGRNRHGPPWNELWARLYKHIGECRPDLWDSGFFVCNVCYGYMKGGVEFPPLSIFNNLDVDEVPTEIADLNEFEKLCLQRGKCFQVVCRLGSVGSKVPPSDRLKAVKGQVLYYPLPLTETIKQLSEASEKAPGLHVLLNSVPTKNRDIWQSMIRLEKVKEAMQWLKGNNPLYKDVDMHRWMLSIEKLITPDGNLEEETEENISETDVQEACQQLAQRGAFPKATGKPMLKELDPKERARILDSYTIRPLDRDMPQESNLQMFQMMRVEEDKVDNRNPELDLACFPGLYPKGRFGQVAFRPQKVKPSEFAKNRLMHEDPRFRRDHQYLFHLLWDYELRAMSASIYQTLRNTKRFDNLSIEEFVQMVSEGNKQLEHCLTNVFRNMRGSPEYWKQVKMKVLCMIRELGPPTWFHTLSAAEFDWEDMSQVLRVMNSDLPNIDTVRTSTLTAIDPVMTQDHFHHRFVSFFNEVILSKEAPPLGLIWDYFWRVEYQCRGHIHYHTLLWVKDAPRVGVDSDEVVKNFINKHVTCRLPNPQKEPILHKLVDSYQLHRCSSYCLKTIKLSKRRAPDDLVDDSGVPANAGFIKKCRFGFPRPVRDDLHFRDPLQVLGKRRQGKFEKRFYDLPRAESERRVNDYNEIILLGWKANIDVSFVGESTTTLANYTCGYVTKGEKGATELWESIDKNECVWKQLYAYAFAKLRNRECGIIEAVDRLRGQPLYGKSRETVYINARMPSSRTVCMKPWAKLKQMQADNPNSKEKYEQNWIDDHYPNRPKMLEETCLYDFMRLYKKVKTPEVSKERDLRFLNGVGGVQMRGDPLLVSHPVFKKPEDIEAYRYSLLLMFKPFRREVEELLAADGKCGSIFEKELITNVRMSQHHQMLQAQVAQFAAQEEEIRKAEESPDSQEVRDPDALGMPAHIENAVEELTTAMGGDVSGSTWEEDFEKMNDGQRRVFKAVTNRLSDPKSGSFRMFVTGAGGTGKSFLAHAVKKFVQQYYFEADLPTVAISAPTGLAAFNVGGMTLHRLFKLPVQHGTTGPWFKLNADERSKLAGTLRNLKLLIIDEISMVSNLLLLYVNKRLQEILGGHAPFGGISVLAMGDLAQLKPVNAQYVFETISSDDIVARNLGVGSNNIWLRDFDLYDELTENMRQKEDPEYAAILERLRFGSMTQDDVAVLESRCISLKPAKKDQLIDALADQYLKIRTEDAGAVCLLPTTKMVMQFNSCILEKEKSKVVQVPAIDRIHGHHTKAELIRARVQLINRSKKVSTTAGVEMLLNLAVGARVMLRRNINVGAGLVNGAIGTVQEFIWDRNVVRGIRVLFDNATESHIIPRYSVSFNLNSRIVVFLQQIPVTLAYSMTIHKSQGLSLSNVILDAGNSLFQASMMYVGMSRVRTLKGLHLINFDPKWAKCSKSCIDEINRLRSRFALDLPQIEYSAVRLGSRKDRKWYESTGFGNAGVDPSPAVHQSKSRQKVMGRGKKCVAPKTSTAEELVKNRAKRIETNPANSGETAAAPSMQIAIRPQLAAMTNPGNACYANSSIHLLFALPRFIDFLQQDAFGGALPALQGLSLQYEQRKTGCRGRSLNATLVRKSLGAPFLTGQQCAREFIEKVLQRVMLEDLFRVTYRRRCMNARCRLNRLGDQVEVSCFLVLDPRSGRTFQEQLQVWESEENVSCHMCHRDSMKCSVDLAQPPDQLLIHVMRHTEGGFDNRGIPGCDPDEIRIGNAKFRVKSLVMHFGSLMISGHYKALVRTDLGWVLCDDQVLQYDDFPWDLKNVYLMMLEKISEIPTGVHVSIL